MHSDLLLISIAKGDELDRAEYRLDINMYVDQSTGSHFSLMGLFLLLLPDQASQ
jgi:hypothetical protein